MSMSTLKDVVEAIKVRSKTIAETTTGTIAGSTANDMVYAAKAIEAITGADALLQLFDESNEPSKVFDYSTSTNGVWTLTIDEITKPVIKFTQASTPSQSELTVVVPNRAFSTVIKNETTKDIYVQYTGETNNANKAKVLPDYTAWVYGDYVASGTNKVQHVVDVEQITSALTTVTTSQGDMIYNQGAPVETTYSIGVKVTTIGGQNYFQFKLPDGINNAYETHINFNIYRGKTYNFDVSDNSMTGKLLKFSTTKDGTHGSGTELLDIAPTDSTNDITYTGTAGQANSKVAIVVPTNATVDTIYPYDATSSATGVGGESQFDIYALTGEARLPAGNTGTALMMRYGIPKWEYVGKRGGYTYRLGNSIDCRVADPEAPGYPGTATNGRTRQHFSLIPEVTDSTNFPLHANKGIYPTEMPCRDHRTWRGGSAVVQYNDNAWKQAIYWGSSTNYSMPDPSNSWKATYNPAPYRDQNKGYDNIQKSEQVGNVIQASRCYDSSYFLDDKGKMWAGGYNNNKQLGVSHTSAEYRMVPVQFPGTADRIIYYALPGGSGSNITPMALDASGNVWCWGYNAQNQVTSNSTATQGIPTQITGLAGKDIKAIQVIDASNSTCYALSGPVDGYKLYAWGRNNVYQCGNGTTNSVASNSPVQLEAGSNKKIVKFATSGSGDNGGCMILNEDGNLYYCGYNNTGQAGDNNASGNKTTPTLVSTFNSSTAGLKVLDMWQGVGLPQGSWYATTDNGDFYKWGPNNEGQSGCGTTSGSQNVPVKDANLTWVSKVVSVLSNTGTYYGSTWCISHDNEEDWQNKVNGTIYSWGYGNHDKGIYGVAATMVNTSPYALPMPYGYQGQVRDIDTLGYKQSTTEEGGYSVLMMDGSLWTQGYGSTHQMGQSWDSYNYNLTRKSEIG
jgi:alpha-tubulin suppressor-like RCC1 family protein